MSKRRLNITIDEDMFIAFKMDVRSASAVINNLLKDQFLQANREKLIAVVTQQVKDALTADQIWLNEVRGQGATVVRNARMTTFEEKTAGLGEGVELPPTITLPACCFNSNPCKHWAYDGLNDRWQNSISGEIREI
jgi:hypothetical protein